MASASVEAGLEPVSEAPATLLRDVLAEGVKAVKTRGYAILRLSEAASEAMTRLRASQTAFFATPREEKKKFVECHPVKTHGISEVTNLKYYFQARAGGANSGLPFPASSSEGTPDFGIAATDAYTQLDLLGRSCLIELAPSLNVGIDRIADLMDPIGSGKEVKMEDISKEKILELKFKSTRNGGSVSSDFFSDRYVSSSNLDLFYYHNDPTTGDKWALNHPSHTDSGIISLIPVSAVPALDFLDQTLNQWIAIEKVIQEQAPALGLSHFDLVVVMAGDTLEWLAKNSFKAGMHRVVRTQQPRESAVYKLRARPERVGPRYEVDYVIVPIQRDALGLPSL